MVRWEAQGLHTQEQTALEDNLESDGLNIHADPGENIHYDTYRRLRAIPRDQLRNAELYPCNVFVASGLRNLRV